MHSRGDSAMLCVLCSSPDCRIYIVETKTTCCLCLQSPQKLKNYFDSIHRTPLGYASCFTAQLTSIAQRVAVARNPCFSATAPHAQGLCQTLSVLQIVWLFHSSTAMARKEKHSPSGVHDNIIAQQTDTEIGTCL